MKRHSKLQHENVLESHYKCQTAPSANHDLSIFTLEHVTHMCHLIPRVNSVAPPCFSQKQLRPRDRDLSQSRSMDPWDSWEKSLPRNERVFSTEWKNVFHSGSWEVVNKLWITRKYYKIIISCKMQTKYSMSFYTSTCLLLNLHLITCIRVCWCVWWILATLMTPCDLQYMNPPHLVDDYALRHSRIGLPPSGQWAWIPCLICRKTCMGSGALNGLAMTQRRQPPTLACTSMLQQPPPKNPIHQLPLAHFRKPRLVRITHQ